MTLYEYFLDHLPYFHQFRIFSEQEERTRYDRSPYLFRTVKWRPG